ncbi:MAG: hypothetical protein GXO22_07270 [Aquificae bacterium]|nr:hypothetical protein [Aquificota bacterium]
MIPLISDLLNLVDTAIDKVFPDADKKEEIKSKLKLTLLEQALEEKKLIFQDLQSARELYKHELQEQGVYSWVKSLRALVRPTIALSSVSFYIGAKVYGIPLTEFDYYLIGGVFAFYFGLRTIEKRSGKA